MIFHYDLRFYDFGHRLVTGCWHFESLLSHSDRATAAHDDDRFLFWKGNCKTARSVTKWKRNRTPKGALIEQARLISDPSLSGMCGDSSPFCQFVNTRLQRLTRILTRRQRAMFRHLFIKSDDFRRAWQFADRCLY